MSNPIELVEDGGEDPKPKSVDPKIWNTEAPQLHTTTARKDFSVVTGNELVVSSAFKDKEGTPKVATSFQPKNESSPPEGLAKAKTQQKEVDLKPAPDYTVTTSTAKPATDLKAPSYIHGEGSSIPLKSTSQQSFESASEISKTIKDVSPRIESPALASDLVSKQLTLNNTQRSVLPTVDLIESRSLEPTVYKQPLLQARVEHQDIKTDPRIEKPIQVQSQVQESERTAPRLLSRMQDVVQNVHNQPDLQIVDKTNPPQKIEVASNAIIERHEDNSLSIKSAQSERPVSARLELAFANASTTIAPLATDSTRHISNPINNTFLGFSRFVEMNNIETRTADLAHRPVVPITFNIRAHEVIARTLPQTLVAPEATSLIRSTYVSSIIKSVLAGLQNNSGLVNSDAQPLMNGPRINLDAHSIIKANFNPATHGTTGNGALVRGDFTVRDFRPLSANISSMPSDLRTDIRGQLSGITPVEFSFGKRKKKELFPGRRFDNTNAPSRYISGLELGLIIALAGIAKFDSTDRTNRKVFNQTDTSKFNSLDVSHFANSICKSIENKKVSKRLPSYNWNNEWKSPGKIKAKNLLEKIKKERKDLKSEDLEKLQSSSNAEEMMSRLAKMIKQDQKSLDAKHMLSSFSSRLQDKLKLNQNNSKPAQSISNYRPLWQVLENDSLTNLAEQIYQDSDVAWLIADMNLSRVRETWMNNKRVIQMQSRQQIELPIQEDINLFKQNKNPAHCAENLITVVIENQLDKDHLNSQLQALQINRKAIGST
ncbi:MAG: hypothetical protein KIT34_06770 [Cyanobacteria bacterium TGS_CYA1]|nr:hypothetical protein [Cyanobacteria bacterium TGS_CYA1]